MHGKNLYHVQPKLPKLATEESVAADVLVCESRDRKFCNGDTGQNASLMVLQVANVDIHDKMWHDNSVAFSPQANYTDRSTAAC
jgi:hypothetical protein